MSAWEIRLPGDLGPTELASGASAEDTVKGPGVVRIAEAYLPLGMHFKLYLDGRLVEDIDTDDTGVGFVGARTLERAYNHNVRVVLSNGAVTALSCELVVRGEYGRFTRY